MADTASIEDSQQFSSHVSRRRVVAGAVTLSAGADQPLAKGVGPAGRAPLPMPDMADNGRDWPSFGHDASRIFALEI
jgi:hypothetical protein